MTCPCVRRSTSSRNISTAPRSAPTPRSASCRSWPSRNRSSPEPRLPQDCLFAAGRFVVQSEAAHGPLVSGECAMKYVLLFGGTMEQVDQLEGKAREEAMAAYA